MPARCPASSSQFSLAAAPAAQADDPNYSVLYAVRSSKTNITGFDLRAFRAAAAKPKYDPWERAETWRYEGTFSRWNRFNRALPGLGTATVAFAAYCVYEHFFLSDSHHHTDADVHDAKH